MSETILLIGGGGREHAIARALRVDDQGGDSDTSTEESNRVQITIHACANNRNPGIARLADGFETYDITDPEMVVEHANRVEATLAIVGPETPLASGVVDALSAEDIYTFGPTAGLARIESDKAYQRRFMEEHDIPGCPEFVTFTDIDDACAYIDEFEGDLAVKPAGLTGGKGVKVIGDQVTSEEAKTYLRESEYEEVVLEERLIGEEFTVQTFVANGEMRATPAVQDHKRAYEGDEGPNTGGMGSYSDSGLTLPFMTEEHYYEAINILQRTVDALDGYRGILYGQFMLTTEGVKVVEFNARFGDPEAMNTLPVMNTQLVDVLVSARDGETLPRLSFAPKATVCKYAVPKGYPTDPNDGAKITIDESTIGDALLFYASVDEREDGIYTTTSRSFAVVGVADTLSDAESIAENALAEVSDDDFHIRHDIGTSELIQTRIDHMDGLRTQ